jgi:hypothetical protein
MSARWYPRQLRPWRQIWPGLSCASVVRSRGARRPIRCRWVEGGTEGALTDLARELKQELPSSTPPTPAALFIHRDILITSQRNTLSRQLITALWVPHHAHASR